MRHDTLTARHAVTAADGLIQPRSRALVAGAVRRVGDIAIDGRLDEAEWARDVAPGGSPVLRRNAKVARRRRSN